MTLAPGSRVGPYIVDSVLAAGGMGVVYRARDEAAGRSVALKVPSAESLRDPRALARFRREALAQAAISHPNVARVHRLVDDPPAIALELLDRGSLADRMAKDGPLPWRAVARIGVQLAHALAALHAAGLVHRDVKPANVLFGEDGQAKLADLGLVKVAPGVLSATDSLTATGEVVGSFTYLAPEQADGTREVDGRADLYALGATLYHALAGRPPHEGHGIVLLRKHLQEEPLLLSKSNPEVPDAFVAVVSGLLEKEPAERPTAQVVAMELGRLETSRAGATRRALRVVLLLVVMFGVGLAAGRFRSVAPSPALTRSGPPPLDALLVQCDDGDAARALALLEAHPAGPRVALARALALSRLDRHDEALAALASAERDPARQARVLARAGKVSRAVSLLASVPDERLIPDHAPALVQAAREALRPRNLPETDRLITRALRAAKGTIAPEVAAPFVKVALAHAERVARDVSTPDQVLTPLRRAAFVESARAFRLAQALDARVTIPASVVELCGSYYLAPLEDDTLAERIEALSLVTEAGGPDQLVPGALASLARHAFEKRSIDEAAARRLLALARTRAPASREVSIATIGFLKAASHWEEALALARAAKGSHSEDPVFAAEEVELLIRVDRLDEARAVAARELERRPGSGELLLQRGRAFATQRASADELALAVTFFQAALGDSKLGRGTRDRVREYLASIALRSKRPQEALDLLEGTSSDGTDRPSHVRLRVLALTAVGQLTEAALWLEKLAGNEAGEATLWMGLASRARNAKDDRDRAEIAQEVARRVPAWVP